MEINYKKANLGNLSLAYLEAGNGNKVILLLHGFASTAKLNWQTTGWLDLLTKNGFKCIAPDQRGHGASDKFYKPQQYGPDIFALDAKNLLNHLAIKKCAVLGFSMGARVAAWFCYQYQQYVTHAILGGMGDSMLTPKLNHQPIVDALETNDPTTITNKTGLAFRTFADKTNSDRLALAACIRPSRQKITKNILAQIKIPTLIIVGSQDEIAGDAHNLANLIPNAQAEILPNYDHMRTSGCTEFKTTTISFLQKVKK